MQIGRETQAIIDSLSDPVLIMGFRRGYVVACNAAFIREMGGFEEAFTGRSLLRMPQFSRSTRRGLLALYLRTKQMGEKEPFLFEYANPQGAIKTISATAEILNYEGEECVVAYLRVLRPIAAAFPQLTEDIAAINTLLDMTRESWLEFRLSTSVDSSSLDEGERTHYLLSLGRALLVHRVSNATRALLGGPKNGASGSDAPLMQKSFISLFRRDEDALRFLDILTTVGHLQAPTTLVNEEGENVEVEMTCSARFERGDEIAAIYCIPSPLERYRSSKSPDAVVRQEHEFILTQPFLGLGRLVPLRPIIRPIPTDADRTLNSYLDSILLITANDALAAIHGVPKRSLLMQSMARFFPYRPAGIQVLKELFVMRQTSFVAHDETMGDFQRVSLFKAVFNDADHMVRIFLASSLQAQEFPEPHAPQRVYAVPAFI